MREWADGGKALVGSSPNGGRAGEARSVPPSRSSSVSLSYTLSYTVETDDSARTPYRKYLREKICGTSRTMVN